MKFSDYIDEGAKIAGSMNKLACELGLTHPNLRSMKAGRRAMPDEACVKLGVIVGLERPVDMIAIQHASRATTEEETNFWAPFVSNVRMHSHALGIVAMVCAATIAGVTALRETRALTDVSATLHMTDYQNSIVQADNQKFVIHSDGTNIIDTAPQQKPSDPEGA